MCSNIFNINDLSFPSYISISKGLYTSNSFSKASNPQPLNMQDKTKSTFSYVKSLSICYESTP